MKPGFIFALLTILSASACSQAITPPEGTAVKWYTIQEAEKLNQASPRPIFIDTYTDWCGWCKKMDKDTFTNSVISDLLNNKFYPVKFNAEGKESVTFLGQTFITFAGSAIVSDSSYSHSERREIWCCSCSGI
jgi:thiol:disulfide interchange protein